MRRRLIGAAAVALLGAVVGAGGLAAAYSLHPDVVFEMDRDLPRAVTGVYPIERIGDETLAWASSRVRLALPGASRRTAWKCAVRFRGGRPAGVAQPVVELATDGLPRASRPATNVFETLEAAVPPSSSDGLILIVASSTTFVPGPQDPRELAIQIDSLACRPDRASGVVWPPTRAWMAAAAGAAIFGAAFVLAGVSAGTAAAAVLLLAIVQALPLSSGMAPFVRTGYPVIGLAGWISLLTAFVALGLEKWKGAPLRHAARFALLFTAAVLYLKLLALLHPSKLPVDVVFQAHRLEWVMAGRLFFTQPLPSGVQMPYAIALYVFAMPWSALTRDHAMLLRIVVLACEAVTGGLLYVLVARIWNDRRAGAVAVVLFSLVPMAYGVIGNANLTNAFGQAASLAALTAATLWTFDRRGLLQTAGLTVLVAIALLSHVSTFAHLSATLAALAVLTWLAGGTAARKRARAIVVGTAIAAVVSVALYYRHFGAEYQALLRSRTAAPAAAAAAPAPGGAVSLPPPATPITRRVAAASDLMVWSIGWPILLLASAGAWRTWLAGMRDPLALLVAAMTAACLAFAAVGVLSPVSSSLERYAAEFIGRVAFAVYPAAVLLAARGAVWLWCAHLASRAVSAVLLVAAVVVGTRLWFEWFTG